MLEQSPVSRSEKFLLNSFLLSGFASVMRQYSLNPLELLEKHHIPKEALLDPNVIISQIDFVNLINESAALTQNPLFGIELSRHFQFDSLGIRNSFFDGPSSLAGVPILVSYYNLSQKSGAKIDLEMTDQYLLHKISYVFEDELDCDIYKQISLGLAAVLYRKYAEQKCQPVRIFLSKDYRDRGTIEDFFACPATLGADTDALALPKDFVFESPVNLRDGSLRRSKNFGHVFRESEFLIELLQRVIALHLPVGKCNREAVARAVGMHYKTLQAELKRRGTSFVEVLTDYRYKEARKLLATTNFSITQIAVQVGYSETAVFTRSFKSWSGVTPLAWRKQNRSPASV